ncbi:Hypothetical protein CINCED_3A004556 [Cinara cedri]|uniref:Uncharacterized protein n=1 Tax=Cinara cedri TaxID=506608 RepID=A0A5E4NI22_9HEMI|nr:Hypothetical protein CINCED_3A004556 [Cinara cedri]
MASFPLSGTHLSESLINADIFNISNILNEPETDSANEAINEEEISVVELLYEVPKLRIIFMNF